MQTQKLALLFGFCVGAFGVLGALGACSAPSAPPISTLPGIVASRVSDPTGGSAGMAAGGSGGAMGTGGTGGIPSTGGSAGAAGAAGAAGSAGSAGAAGAAGGSSTLSAGCGKPLPALITVNKWSDMADQPARAGFPPPIMVDGIKRGFYMFVKSGYDPNKPTRVIYEGAGCGDTSDAHGGTSGYAYQNVDGSSPEQTIQVGIDYSRGDNCYDNSNPNSNDFKFFPILHKFVEDNFCVDLNRQFYSGYSTGAWMGNQFTCAFPDVLKAFVFATGNEPPANPPCVPGHPVPGLFLHDSGDPYNSFSGMLPGCTRLLKQNGCTTTACVPTDTSTTTTYQIPTTLGNGAPSGMQCVSFNGCPPNAPVVWCTTALNGDHRHYIGDDNWVTPLFWDFFSKF